MKGKLNRIVVDKLINGYKLAAEFENMTPKKDPSDYMEDIEEEYVFVSKEEVVAKITELL